MKKEFNAIAERDAARKMEDEEKKAKQAAARKQPLDNLQGGPREQNSCQHGTRCWLAEAGLVAPLLLLLSLIFAVKNRFVVQLLHLLDIDVWANFTRFPYPVASLLSLPLAFCFSFVAFRIASFRELRDSRVVLLPWSSCLLAASLAA